jgi:hypothetical protein
MKRTIVTISLALALWLGAGALPVAHAASEGIQLADYHDTAQRRELQRLQDERQKALDKAAQSRKRQTRRSRRRVQQTSQPQQRLTLSLPPGWSSGEAHGGLKDAAIGDAPAFAKARTEKTAYIPGGTPGRSPEVIVYQSKTKKKKVVQKGRADFMDVVGRCRRLGSDRGRRGCFLPSSPEGQCQKGRG